MRAIGAVRKVCRLGLKVAIFAILLLASVQRATAAPGYLVTLGPDPANCVASSNVWITNVVVAPSSATSQSIAFSITGGSDGVPYDVFASTAISGNKPGDSTWTWMGQGVRCMRYQLNNLPTNSCFLILGTPKDSDSDGLTDAYELLVNKSDPFTPDGGSYGRKRLGYWNFDTPALLGDQGQVPICTSNLQSVTGWITNAVRLNSSSPVRLAYNVLEADGNANLNLTNGSIRLRFKPDWHWDTRIAPYDGRLVDVGDKSSSNGWWGLSVTNFGQNLIFSGQSNGIGTIFLTADLGLRDFNWSAGSWIQIVLSYSPSNSSVYVVNTDGFSIAAFGAGVTLYPNQTGLALSGLNVGCDLNGTNQIKGTIDELETFNYPLDLRTGPFAGDQYLIPTGQVLAAPQNRSTPRYNPLDLKVSPDGTAVYVKTGRSLDVYDTATLSRIHSVDFESGEFAGSLHGIAFGGFGQQVYAYTTVTGSDTLNVYALSNTAPGALLLVTNISLGFGSDPSGVAISPDGHKAYVCLSQSNALATVDLGRGTIVTQPVGIFPYAVVLSKDGSVAYVSNYGGRRAAPGDSLTGSSGNGTQIPVNANGIPTNGVVSFVDIAGARGVLADVTTGIQPTGMVLSPDGSRLYVANADSDTVSVIDTSATNVITNIMVRPYPDCPFNGSTPNSLALSPDGGTLFVANAGNNAIAMVSTADNQVLGLIPTDWYPSGVATDGTNIFVANLWGLSFQTQWPYVDQDYEYSGTVQKLAIPSPAASASNSATVLQNARIPQMQAATNSAQPGKAGVPVPRNVGEPSVFQHVFYIIKENKTYDQVFGDIPSGNGCVLHDNLTNLVMFGNSVTPNQHALASQFVLLDNYYCTGVGTDDGHAWSTQGFANAASQKAALGDGGAHGRFYGGGDVTLFTASGFIWDNVAAHGLTFTNFGEFGFSSSSNLCFSDVYANYLAGMYPGGFAAGTSNMAVAFPLKLTANLKSLASHSCPSFPGWDETSLHIPDVLRADAFIYQLTNADSCSSPFWPNFTIMHLPNDHTGGTCPGDPQPASKVADNDLAVGRIVDAISHSSFWSNSVIFIIEDDPQGGFDHVDGHRSICMVVSPYTKRGQTISTFYNQPGVVHTMEQILGLPPMNQMDAIAPLMTDCFTLNPDFTPFNCLAATTSLTALVPPLDQLTGKARYWAMKSMKLDLRAPDRANPNTLSHILWFAAHGEMQYPSRYVGTNKKNLAQLGLAYVKPPKTDDDD